MTKPKTLEEKLLELKEQNSELTKTAQFWRVQYKKAEDDKMNLIKENHDLLIKKKQYSLKVRRNCDMLMQLVCRSMKDFLQFTNCVENTMELINEFDGNYADPVSRDSSGVNFTPSNSPSNVLYVRPMIQGVTLKMPVLRVSRANLDNLNRSGEKTPKNDTPRISPRTQTQVLSNSLVTIDNTLQSNTPTRRDTNLSQLQEEPIGNASTLDADELMKVKCFNKELSVSLSRMDSFIQRFLNKDKSSELIDELKDDQNDAKIENKENTFINEDEIFTDEFQGSDCLKYNSRLECIIEETESENSSITFNKNLHTTSLKDDLNNKEYNKTEQDPLEGPSWRFTENTKTSSGENSPMNSVNQYNFITVRKKTIVDESMFESSVLTKDLDQVPDSTTDMKDNIHNMPQSTPAPDKASNPNKSVLSPTIDQNLESTSCEETNSDSTKELSDHVVLKKDILSDTEDKLNKNAEKKSPIAFIKNVKENLTSKKSKGRSSGQLKNRISKKKSNTRTRNDSESSESSNHSTTSVPSVNQLDSDSRESVNSNGEQVRPRRGIIRKDYKEMSCTKKLRRS